MSYLSLLGQLEGIQYNSEEALNGYTLIDNFSSTFLVDNCGNIVNEWEGLTFAQYHFKLLPNGNLIFLRNNEVLVTDWDNNIVSKTGYNLPNVLLTYEVIQMNNGNYLCIGREFLSSNDFTQLGFDPLTIHREVDVIVEIDPSTEEVVWMWNIKDHIIQERDSLAANYGKVIDNPGKLDVDAIGTFDWRSESFMINGFDYNEELDLIALSIRKMGEVIIIDHSTTTEEAQTDSGGKYGKGGDVLFRWGNPQNYGRGTVSDRYLYYQHNPNWIKYGEHKGKLIMYNNNLSAETYSSVEVIDPSFDSEGNFILPANGPFQLDENPISINEVTTGTSFSSQYTSSAKVLPNGNILITSGGSAEIIEVNFEGEILWQYNIPQAVPFRSEKYPQDYPAFTGRDLEPQGVVESIPSNYPCELDTSNKEVDSDNHFEGLITQTANHIFIENKEGQNFDVIMYNLSGQVICKKSSNYFYKIDKATLSTGQYFIQMTTEKKFGVTSVFVH